MAGGRGKINEYNKSLSPEARKAAAIRASKASAEKQRRKRLWKESVEHLMGGKLSKEDAQRIAEQFGLTEDIDQLTQQDQVIAAVAAKAKRGDKDCAQFLRDTAGQNPQVMVKVGNLDDKPFQTLDLGSLSDDDLRRLAEREQPEE